MTITRELEEEVRLFMDNYWNTYLEGDLQTWSTFLTDDYKNIGGTEEEIWNSRQEILDYSMTMLDQMVGNAQLRNKQTQVFSLTPYVLVHEFTDMYIKIESDWVFYGKFRLSSILKRGESAWQVVHQHGSYPDAKTEQGEAFAFDKISTENRELKDAIKRRTIELENKARELEIETSLEKVRAVAMGMKKPDDLLNICQALFKELQALGFSQVRNTIIHTFVDEQGYLIDYNYSDFIGGTTGRIPYKGNKVVEKFIREIRKTGDAFTEIMITGKDLEEFKAFRIANKEAPDPRLDSISSLYYYFYSIGTGAIGISTFDAIANSKQELLKRFRNVFELSYQRYTDIANAEAQAREAKIEVSLEKVRARAMGMHHSDELSAVLSVLFEQFDVLGISPMYTFLSFIDLEKNNFTYRQTGRGGKRVIAQQVIDIDAMDVWKDVVEKWKAAEYDKVETMYVPIELVPQVFEVYKEIYTALPEDAKVYPEDFPDGIYTSLAASKFGHLGYDHYKPSTDEEKAILLKFNIEFVRLYQRFLDLQKAEAQTREAQIELALERVRARTMAMHKSEELADVAALVFEQLTGLGVQHLASGFTIIDKEKPFGQMWLSYRGDMFPKPLPLDFNASPILTRVYRSWKDGESSFVNLISGEQFFQHVQFLKKNFGERVEQFIASTNQLYIDAGKEVPNQMVMQHTFFSNGSLIINNITPIEQQDILNRFAKVFDQTYTRFLDLQKSEAQAREAKIENALEKIRSRTMAMQRSDELPEVANNLFLQVQSLEIPAWSAGYCVWDEDKQGITLWMSSEGVMQPSAHAPCTEDPSFIHMREAYERGDTFYVEEVGGEALVTHYKYMRTLPVVGEILDSIIAAGHPLPTFQIFHCVYFSQGFLLFITYEPVPEAHSIFKRFTKVFEQTYTRFLDLQKAEAQAREAQIEVAVERVRAKALAMHKSEDIIAVIKTLRNELTGLNVPGVLAATIYLKEENDRIRFWDLTTLTASEEGDHFSMDMYLPRDAPSYLWFQKMWAATEKYFIVVQDEHDLKLSMQWIKEFINEEVAVSTLEFLETNNVKQLWHPTVKLETGLLNIDFIQPPPDEMESILSKMGAAFDLAYKRFIDLKNAEAQTRQAQIEMVIERVRAKALAMHKSEEILAVVVEMQKGLAVLDMPGITAATIILKNDEETLRIWDFTSFDDQGKDFQLKMDYVIRTDDIDPEIYIKKIWYTTDSYFVVEEDERSLAKLITWLRTFDGKSADEVERLMKKYGIKQGWHPATQLENGKLCVDFIEPPPAEMESILPKMGVAFDLAYRRFVDLKNAEEQARDARIEAALEKVRSRSLAMHKSDELREVITVVLESLQKLGVAMDKRSAVILIFEPGSKSYIQWVASPEHAHSISIKTPYFDHPVQEDIWNNWKKGSELFSRSYSADEKNNLFQRLFMLQSFQELPESEKKWILESKGYDLSIALEKNSAVAIASLSGNLLSEFENDILKRFAKVFEQSYTRFLDLQKVEAQAREAQIEAALERIRTTAMSMQKSEDLAGAVSTVFKELDKLNLGMERCGIGILNREKRTADVWTTSKSGDKEVQVSGDESMDIHPLLSGAFNSWLTQVDHEYILEGKDLNDYYEALTHVNFNLPESPELARSEGMKQFYFNAVFSAGGLFAFRGSPFPEEAKSVMKRFAQVFSLTYTRFNDLVQAEAQTRQAKIEAALERVRARALAMQEPEELIEVAEVLRHEMGVLGVEELETCSIYIHDEAIQRTECWYALKDIRSEEKILVNDHFSLNLKDTWVGREMEKFFGTGVAQTSIVMQGKNRREWIKYCEERSAPLLGYYGEKIPDRTYHLYRFTHGAIGVASAADISAQSWDLLQRAAAVFSLAYSRFKDLTQARSDLQNLKEEKKRAEDALSVLKATQVQLIQAEKMASLGELTAGIAHEIQNPLNFVNNFSEVSNELIEEMNEEIAKGNLEDAKAIANDIRQNLEKINHHGKRADGIVKGMLQHSRKSSGQKELTDINELADEYLRLSYHGLRAKDKSFNARFETDFDTGIGKVNVVPQDIGRVILNLINNAFYAVTQKRNQSKDDYEPVVRVTTRNKDGTVEISVKDNGNGIPAKVMDKIFQPFFTTKPAGQGTGLGLSLSYDIVTKGHGGELKVQTKENEGSEFIVYLPVYV